MARLKTDSMLFPSQYKAVFQLFAITLHTFLLGIVVLASVPQVSDSRGIIDRHAKVDWLRCTIRSKAQRSTEG